MQAIARGLYNLLQTVVLPVFLPVAALHPRLRGSVGERLGGGRRRTADNHVRTVWMHGSSAGDVKALGPLGRELAAAGSSLVVSAWTRSGHAMAQETYWGSGCVGVFRAPLDLPFAVRHVLRRVRPSALVLECLEIWPNWIHHCEQRDIPVAVVNGRLSERSLHRYQRARWLFEPCFRRLAFVSALTELDAERFVRLGVNSERVIVETSSKHSDFRPLGTTQTSGQTRLAGAGPKLVLGSVHPREGQILLPWVVRLVTEIPRLRVVVAPRYPHHGIGIMTAFVQHGIRAQLLTRLIERQEQTRPAVVVFDMIGQLADAYNDATVAFVGGSLIPLGGHNVIEPAARGAVVLTGPHTHHCALEMAQLMACGAGRCVRSGDEFYRQAAHWLSHAQEARHVGERGKAQATRFAGAAGRIGGHLKALLSEAR